MYVYQQRLCDNEFVMVRSSNVRGLIMTMKKFRKISATYLVFYHVREFSEKTGKCVIRLGDRETRNF
jgi:hypothetical protein